MRPGAPLVDPGVLGFHGPPPRMEAGETRIPSAPDWPVIPSRLLPLLYVLPCLLAGCAEGEENVETTKRESPAKALSGRPEAEATSPTEIGKKLAGTYRVNLEAYAKEWLRMAQKDLPKKWNDQHRKAASESNALEEVKDFRMELELLPDQTFTHRTKARLHARETVASGTWSLEGEKISFVTKRFDGEVVKDAEPYSGSYKKGRIVLETGDGPSYVLDLQ